MISLCLLYLLRLYLPEGTGNGLLILKPLREAGIGDLTVSDLKTRSCYVADTSCCGWLSKNLEKIFYEVAIFWLILRNIIA